MRRARGFIGVVLAAAVGVGFAGCDTLDSLDFDFLNTKKKLPGERRPVFPEGVPGVAQGVPAEYRKGYDEKAAQTAPDPATEAVQQIAPEKEAKPKPVAKPKPKPAARQPQQTAAPAQQQRTPPQQPAQASPWPQQQQSSPPSQSSPWPQQQPQAAWPTAPDPNKFSR